MIPGIVVLSALLHALWNALLKREADKTLAGVIVVFVAWLASVATAIVVWRVTARAPFHDAPSFGASALAGLFEGAYFVTLVLALERAPLGVAYTISRGGAILVVWPISVLFLHEALRPLAIAGTAIVAAGLVATGFERARRGVGWAAICALCIAGYHLAYKRALSTGASPPAVFAVSLAVAVPINLVRLGPARWPELGRRAVRYAAPGLICGASFLVFLVALARGGAGYVLTLRNTSVVFAIGLGALLGDVPTRRQVIGAILVAAGAIVLGLA
jgi:drug/metabolite transporter (DMT)-like permease